MTSDCGAPAARAKEYAAAHGFDIEPIGRRYNVSKIGDTVWHAEVGGYPAALNAMQRYVSAAFHEVVSAHTERVLAEHLSIDVPLKAYEILGTNNEWGDEPIVAVLRPWLIQCAHAQWGWCDTAHRYATYPEAITACRRMRNTAALRDITRRVVYVP